MLILAIVGCHGKWVDDGCMVGLGFFWAVQLVSELKVMTGGRHGGW